MAGTDTQKCSEHKQFLLPKATVFILDFFRSDKCNSFLLKMGKFFFKWRYDNAHNDTQYFGISTENFII
jgi:hypothetical protein